MILCLLTNFMLQVRNGLSLIRTMQQIHYIKFKTWRVQPVVSEILTIPELSPMFMALDIYI